MKKSVALIALILCFAAVLCSCGGVEKMKYNEDGLLCGKNAKYRFAPMGYEPTAKGEEYALIDNEMQELLYTVGDADPEKWLATEYLGAATMVYYSEDIDLPTLADMKPEKCYFCEQSEIITTLGVIGGDERGDELIAHIVEALNDSSTENEIWPRSDVNETYQLKFYSSDWPAIYYNVVYSECSSGNYLYDKVLDKCIKIGDVFSDLQ